MGREEFRRLRRLAGLTQEQTARMLEVSHRTVLRWEAGDTHIGPLQGEAIRLRLVGRLFGGDKGEGAAKTAYQ